MSSKRETSSVSQTVIFLLSLTVVIIFCGAPGLLDADGQTPEVRSSYPGFASLPGWARAHLPPLPDQLKPYGKAADSDKPVAAVSPTPTPAPQVAAAPAKPPQDDSHKSESPLSAITPFLDWVKADPNAAAEAARREAAKYPVAPATPEPALQGFDPNRPYWLPPLRNSTDNNSAATPTPSGADATSSSAVYQRPSQ